MKNKFLITCLAAVLILLGFPNATNTIDLVLNLLLTGFVFVVVCVLPHVAPKYFSPKIVLPLLAIFICSSFINSKHIRTYLSQEPVSYTYRTDMDDFLKTFYFMKQETNYYQSFKWAVEQNPFKGTVSSNLWSWRLPVIFYIWKFLPSATGDGIHTLFVILATLTLFTSFMITKNMVEEKYANVALLSPYLLYGYFHFAVRNETLLQTEWWGIIFLIIGYYFQIKGKLLQAIFFLSLALITRELYSIPVFLGTIFWIIRKHNLPWVYVVPLGVFLAMMGFHGYFVSHYIRQSTQFFNPRIHEIGKEIIQSTFAFGSWEYTFYQWRIFILFFILGFVGVIKHLSEKTFLLLSFFLFPLTFSFIGTSVYNDYWGIMYIPFVLMAVPLVLI